MDSSNSSDIPLKELKFPFGNLNILLVILVVKMVYGKISGRGLLVLAEAAESDHIPTESRQLGIHYFHNKGNEFIISSAHPDINFELR